MLPTEIENLVGNYAYGPGRFNLFSEVDFIAANRGLIPDHFLTHTVALRGHGYRELTCYMVKNPLRSDNPFFPWAQIDKRCLVFANTFMWWCERIHNGAYKELRTYRATFRKHVLTLVARGRDMAREWNFFVNRYLKCQVLTDTTSYNTSEHENTFETICEQLKHSGYLSPKFSLPARPSQRSVLSRASALLA